jgi:anti-sigma regulatory factor (Ser/Thr protein kinase)
VEADEQDGTVTVVVTDRGRWRDARGENRGRGLPLMEALMENVDVRRAGEGTSIVLQRTLGESLP